MRWPRDIACRGVRTALRRCLIDPMDPMGPMDPLDPMERMDPMDPFGMLAGPSWGGSEMPLIASQRLHPEKGPPFRGI